jgi:hypothetical protein
VTVQPGMVRGCLVIGALVLVLAGCARPSTSPAGEGPVQTAGCATATSPPAMTIDGTPQPANQEALDALAGRIEQVAKTRFAAVYTGLELRSEQNRLRVYRVPSGDFDRWLTGTFADDCVEVVDAAHSAQELNALADRITGDDAYWTSQHIPIGTVSPRVDGSGVDVTTTEVARASSALVQRYGTTVPIKVEYGEPPTLSLGATSGK